MSNYPGTPAKEKRNERVLQLHQKGMSNTAIATKLRITKQRVGQIINRAKSRLVEPYSTIHR